MHSLILLHQKLLRQEVIRFPQAQCLLLQEQVLHFGLGLSFDQPS